MKKKEAALEGIRRSINVVSWMRLVAILSLILLGAYAFKYRPALLNLLALPLAIFVILLAIHATLYSKKERLRRILEWYQRGLDRINDRWMGHGNQRTDLVSRDHPYALDLDIFGENSLFELLCTAQTASGEETLARWLSSPLRAPQSSRDKRLSKSSALT